MRSRVVEEKLLLAQQKKYKAISYFGRRTWIAQLIEGLTLTKGLQVFEVDHPSTQIWKRQKLEAS